MEQSAIEKIAASMETITEKRVPAEPIARYLTKKCGEDGEFAALVMQEHKTMEKCFAFVYEQSCNHLNKQSGWIDDNDVYMMAEDYFNLDDAEIERKKAEDEAKRQEERRKSEQEFQQKAAAAKAGKAKNSDPGQQQLSLFDVGESKD